MSVVFRVAMFITDHVMNTFMQYVVSQQTKKTKKENWGLIGDDFCVTLFLLLFQLKFRFFQGEK